MVKIKEAGLSDHPAGGTMIPSQGADLPWGFMDYPINEEEWASHQNVPDVPELESTVTITVEGYLAVVEEAAANAR